MKKLDYAACGSNHVWGGLLSGVFYGDAHDMLKDLRIGMKLLLHGHSDNGHDAFAIGVYAPNENGDWLSCADLRYSRLGWIPNKTDEDKSAKQILWRMLNQGVFMHGVLNSFSHRDGRLSNVAIEILFGEHHV